MPIPFDREAVIERRVEKHRRRQGLPPRPTEQSFFSLDLHCALMDERTNRDAELEALTARVTELEGGE